jgi:hypothetical protein
MEEIWHHFFSNFPGTDAAFCSMRLLQSWKRNSPTFDMGVGTVLPVAACWRKENICGHAPIVRIEHLRKTAWQRIKVLETVCD